MKDAANPGETGPGEFEEDIRDDFLYHLKRGGEMLAGGRLEEAREHFEKASELKPDNSKCQNLLGLVYLKLAHYDQSIAIYRRLVERFPEEAALRVNLASVYIRSDDLDLAESELQAAIKLRPGHAKAHKTLAVVLLRRGDQAGAREQLRLAGVSDDELPAMEDEHQLPEPDGYQRVDAADEPSKAQVGEAPIIEQPAVDQPPSGPIFDVSRGCLAARSPVCARLDSLLWLEGELSFRALRKRFGSRETKYTFGKGRRSMTSIEGSGRLLFATREDGYYIHQLESGGGFFVEDLVVAFGGTEDWENGRLATGREGGPELRIFHAQEPAQVALGGGRSIRSREIAKGAKFMIAAGSLVFWTGSMAARMVETEAPLPPGTWMEFEGQGRVYFRAES